jgi:integrase/recombinase XerD
MPLPELTISVFRERVAARISEVRPTTVNHHIRAFKAFMRWLAEEEYPIALDPRKIKPLKIEFRLPPALTSEQIASILAQPNLNTWTGRRDYCLLCLLMDTGIRVAECLGLSMQQVNEGEATVAVIGKGDKQRVVALSLPMGKVLRRWIRSRERLCAEMGWESELVFLSRSGEGLRYRALARRIHDYGVAAGIQGVRVSAHTFRSTFATHFCRQGGSIVHLQTILGHTTLEMSRRYAAVTDQDAFEASRRFSPLVAVGK